MGIFYSHSGSRASHPMPSRWSSAWRHAEQVREFRSTPLTCAILPLSPVLRPPASAFQECELLRCLIPRAAPYCGHESDRSGCPQ